MKICFFVYNLFDIGGIQRVVSVLASELAKKHEVYIQCYDAPEKADRSIYGLSNRVRVVFARRKRSQSIVRRILRKLNQKSGVLCFPFLRALCEYSYLLPEECQAYRSIIEKKGIDVAIVCGGLESFILASIADQVKCKTIGWQHSSYKAYYETRGVACWGADSVAVKYLPKLDRVVVLNEYDAACYMKHKKIPCTTIYNPKSFCTKQQARLSSKGFIAAGRLIPLKAFGLMIESFRIFAQQNKEWTLTIYGTGIEKQMLERKIREYGLENRIFLPGFSDKMQENLLASSCYLLSSLWEGMPMVVLEALECGVPVVAYNISAMLPLVENGVEGFIVKQFDTEKFAQAMLDIAADDKLRQQMGQAAKKKAKKFDVAYIARQWEEMFCALISDEKEGKARG